MQGEVSLGRSVAWCCTYRMGQHVRGSPYLAHTAMKDIPNVHATLTSPKTLS